MVISNPIGRGGGCRHRLLARSWGESPREPESTVDPSFALTDLLS
jgi:hypothetical protein